jgi:hypothetical protein
MCQERGGGDYDNGTDAGVGASNPASAMSRPPRVNVDRFVPEGETTY